MEGITRRIGMTVVASLFVFALACADTEDGAGANEENSILPAEDPTGGAGDMGSGTGTTAPGSGVGVGDTSLADSVAATGGVSP